MKTAAAIALVLCALLVHPVSALAQAEPPLVAVEALGCVLCEAGQVATFRVNIANPDGVTRIVHLIVQVELPTGDIVPLVEEPVLLQTRFTQRLLVSHPVTPADPAGTYWFDAALFDADEAFIDAYSLRADKID